jgi:hypothetical protein
MRQVIVATFLLLCVVATEVPQPTTAVDMSGFIQGFLTGLQYNSKDPSDCFKASSGISIAAKALISDFKLFLTGDETALLKLATDGMGLFTVLEGVNNDCDL